LNSRTRLGALVGDHFIARAIQVEAPHLCQIEWTPTQPAEDSHLMARFIDRSVAVKSA
jgi:hypothetical protein